MNEITQVINRMKEISEIWKNIYKQSCKYYEAESTSGSYETMINLTNNWVDTYKKQIDIITKIREYCKYIKNEFCSFESLENVTNKNGDIYSKKHKRLWDLKDNLFKNGDLSKWELSEEDLDKKVELLKNKNFAFERMLPNQTKDLKISQELYGALLNSFIFEYERIFDYNNIRHKMMVSDFIKLLSTNSTDFFLSLNNLLGILDTLGVTAKNNDDDNNTKEKEENNEKKIND